MTTLRGKCSWFGGPDDLGVDSDEPLAFIHSVEEQPAIFLDEQPPGTTGLARRLNSDGMHYIATRWNYDVTPKTVLLDMRCLVRNPRTGKTFGSVYPADWGPHEDTGRVADLSRRLMDDLGLSTDDDVEVMYEPPHEAEQVAGSVCISSGHGLHVRGASGIIDEVDEARRVVDRVVATLKGLGVEAHSFHDNSSTTQDENLHTIVKAHEEHDCDWNVSVHFNDADHDPKDPIGTEVWYLSEDELAVVLSGAIADASGLKDRGEKFSEGLYFLNHLPHAVLIEVCFVKSEPDVAAYKSHFIRICNAIAMVLSGRENIA